MTVGELREKLALVPEWYGVWMEPKLDLLLLGMLEEPPDKAISLSSGSPIPQLFYPAPTLDDVLELELEE